MHLYPSSSAICHSIVSPLIVDCLFRFFCCLFKLLIDYCTIHTHQAFKNGQSLLNAAILVGKCTILFTVKYT